LAKNFIKNDTYFSIGSITKQFKHTKDFVVVFGSKFALVNLRLAIC